VKFNKEIREVLWNRLAFSLGILLLIRMGTFLPVPGINHSDLIFYLQRHSATKKFSKYLLW
jgi:preprotein translocase subunit SecY